MKYFLDTEFLEGTQKKWFGQTKPTIDLISIGIVAEDGREYYAISKDFNLKEAWNRFDWKQKKVSDGIPGAYKDYWIRDNVLKPIFIELRAREVEEYNTAKRINVVLNFPKYFFCFREFKRLINKCGKTNKQIAEEVKEFCSLGTVVSNKGCNIRLYKKFTEEVETWIKMEEMEKNTPIHYDNKPQFYGYYCDYDWVVFCWLFGRMIDLPKNFPMYCIDLKQMLDEKISRLPWLYGRDIWSNSKRSISTIGRGEQQEKDREATFDEKLETIKKLAEYPKQTNEHNALSDALWNKELYEFLEKISK